MKTLFDLRENQENEIIEAIAKIYAEPLEVIRLGEGDIRACTGCWSCWLKTPGRCAIKDPMAASYPAYVNSDTFIVLMDTAQGFINHQAKAFLDRTIPLYHPYIELVNGECHHVARYERYPDTVFYVDAEGLTDPEEAVVEDYLWRTAFHFKSKACRIVKSDGLQLRQLASGKAKKRAAVFGAAESMDQLVIYNGSPRKRGSNSALILKKVKAALGDRVAIRDLKKTGQWEEWAAAFPREKHVMFFMPLYVHAMPSHVMAFIEKLQASEGSLSFFVQSGFPESSQSHYLEAYLEQLSRRLNRTYLGTAIRGGVESPHMRPAKAQDKMMEPMVKTIGHLVREGHFHTADIRQLARPVRFGKGVQLLFNLLGERFINAFWDQQMKENGAYEKRFDRPY
ncbi:MAG: hypothetical protein SCK57_12670 [Bacillota bacterium]|nr:hypothetical protein [Bacillota bacterium]